MLLTFLVLSLVLPGWNEALPIALRDTQSSPPSATDAYTTKRSLYGIVWNCITTTFLCAWASMHLDTTHGMSDTWKRRGNRILFLSLSVIIPEYIVGWAMKQRKMATDILKTYKDKGWTMTHAHLLNTGGFALCYAEEKNGEVNDELVEQRVLETLSPSRFKELLAESSIEFPTITTSEIQDRSKTDILAKFIAALQTLWFVLQCIVRHRQNLAITELELTTLALASLNWLTLWFWRDKPHDMTIPVPVYLVEGSPEWSRRRAAWVEESDEKGEEAQLVVVDGTLIASAEQRIVSEWKTRKTELEMQIVESSRWLIASAQELKKHKPESRSFLSRLWISIMRLWRLLLSLFSKLVRALSTIVEQILRMVVRAALLASIGLLAIPIGSISLVMSILHEEPWISINRSGFFPQIHFCQPDIDEGEEWSRILLQQRIHEVHGEVMTQYFHDLNNARRSASRKIRGWWASVDLKPSHGRAVFFLRITLALFALLLFGIPFLGLFLFTLIMLVVISPPLSMFFLRMPVLCQFVDDHIVTHRLSTNQGHIRFYSNIVLQKLNLKEYSDHTSHFLIALTIGTSFGALHCFGWDYTYPTPLEQFMWRASSLVLTIIPSLFFAVSWPLVIIRGPIPVIVIMIYLNLLSLILFAYVVARLIIIGLAFELLRDQPKSAYEAIIWVKLLPHVL